MQKYVELLREPMQVKPESLRAARQKSSSTPPHVYRLNYNESPYGLGPASQAALEEAIKTPYVYPDWFSVELKTNLAELYGLKFENIAVGPGSSAMINMLGELFINPGDEFVFGDPSYEAFRDVANDYGAVPVAVPLDDNMNYDLDAMLAAITDKTKILVVVNPNNPTGTILEYDELLAIANFAQKHNLIVISDEIYGDLTYGERKHICFSALPDMKERSIILNGFSKAYAMTGWRLGYALAPKPVIDAMNKIHQYTMICAPITAQIAGLEAIRNGQKHMKKMVAEYDRRRRLIYEGFTSMGLKCFEPKGAFYIFPDISSTGLSSEEFAEQLLLRQHVAVVPGTAFGECGKGFIRASYATSVDNISGALARIKNFLDNL